MEYKIKCETPSDINEHLPVLCELSRECNHITEMGVRAYVSTWAFLEGLKGRNGTLISIDSMPPEYYGGNTVKVETSAKEMGVHFEFKHYSTLCIVIDPTDLLFIDTKHIYKQLKAELERHSDKAKKYIVLHDVVSCKDELIPAINELLALGKWKIKKEYFNCNGLLILEQI